MTNSRLARRLIFLIVLTSSSIALLITAAQLYMEYRRDLGQVSSAFQQIETSYLDSVVGNVWLADRDRLRILLGGIRNLPDFAYAEVKIDGKVIQSAEELANAEGLLPIGRPLAVEFLREGATRSSELILVASSSQAVAGEKLDPRLGGARFGLGAELVGVGDALADLHGPTPPPRNGRRSGSRFRPRRPGRRPRWP